MRVPKGVAPVFLYATLALLLPLLSHYVTYDFDDDMTRAGIIVAGVAAPAIIILANDCVAWFNMALFFHIGIEVGVMDTLATFALRDNSTASGELPEDHEKVFSWIAFATIALHLLPPLLADNAMLLTMVAAVGIPVNVISLLYLDTDSLLLVSFSAGVYLGVVLLIACSNCVRTSLRSQLMSAMNTGSFVKLVGYEK